MTILNNEIMVATLTTDCQCQDEVDESGEWVPASECFGDCYDWQKEDVYWLIQEWAKGNGFDNDTAIRIDGNGMGWSNASGYKFSKVSELDSAMNLNGDFRLEYRLVGNTLEVERWSHDEPTGGCIFTFTKMEEEN